MPSAQIQRKQCIYSFLFPIIYAFDWQRLLQKCQGAVDAERAHAEEDGGKDVLGKSLAGLGSLRYLFPSVHESTKKGTQEATKLARVPDFWLCWPKLVDNDGQNFA